MTGSGDRSKVNNSITRERYIDRGADTHEPQVFCKFQVPELAIYEQAPLSCQEHSAVLHLSPEYTNYSLGHN